MLKFYISELLSQKSMKPIPQRLVNFGVNVRTAQQLLNGQAKSIKLETLFTLCNALHCTPNDIFNVSNEDGNLSEKHPLLDIAKPVYNQTPDDIIKRLPIHKIGKANELLQKLLDEEA